MALLEEVHLRDTRANQPAAAADNKGVIYCVTDEDLILERSNGSAWQAYSPSLAGAFILPGLCQYRLSGTTATAVTTSEVTTTSTLYWTPYKGIHASLYDGADWQDYNGGELSLALSGLTSGKNYDVFVDYNGGTEQLVLLAWTDDTNRATALTKQDGVYVLTGALDHLYVGTIRTISTTATCDFGGTASLTGGKRFIWNYYNRALRNLKVFDATDSWTYESTTIRQANGQAGNQVEMVIGVSEDAVSARLVAAVNTSGALAAGFSGIGLDSTTVVSSLSKGASFSGTTAVTQTLCSEYTGYPGIGWHRLTWLESGLGSVTVTWVGDATRPLVEQSALQALVWA